MPRSPSQANIVPTSVPGGEFSSSGSVTGPVDVDVSSSSSKYFSGSRDGGVITNSGSVCGDGWVWPGAVEDADLPVPWSSVYVALALRNLSSSAGCGT